MRCSAAALLTSDPIDDMVTEMAKTRTQWVCQSCGRTTLRAMGRCPSCGEWNSMVERIDDHSSTSTRRQTTSSAEPVPLGEIESEGLDRLPMPMHEFSRVLGGGVVPGSLFLVGGEPGI